MEGYSEILPRDLVEHARCVRDCLHDLGLNAYPGGQLVDDHGIWWCPSDPTSWHARGSGDPLPRLDHPGTVLALVGIVKQPFPGRAPLPPALAADLATALGDWLTAGPEAPSTRLQSLWQVVLVCLWARCKGEAGPAAPRSWLVALLAMHESAGLVDLERLAEVSASLQRRIVQGGDVFAPALELALAVPHLLKALKLARAQASLVEQSPSEPGA